MKTIVLILSLLLLNSMDVNGKLKGYSAVSALKEMEDSVHLSLANIVGSDSEQGEYEVIHDTLPSFKIDKADKGWRLILETKSNGRMEEPYDNGNKRLGNTLYVTLQKQNPMTKEFRTICQDKQLGNNVRYVGPVLITGKRVWFYLRIPKDGQEGNDQYLWMIDDAGNVACQAFDRRMEAEGVTLGALGMMLDKEKDDQEAVEKIIRTFFTSEVLAKHDYKEIASLFLNYPQINMYYYPTGGAYGDCTYGNVGFAKLLSKYPTSSIAAIMPRDFNGVTWEDEDHIAVYSNMSRSRTIAVKFEKSEKYIDEDGNPIVGRALDGENDKFFERIIGIDDVTGHINNVERDLSGLCGLYRYDNNQLYYLDNYDLGIINIVDFKGHSQFIEQPSIVLQQRDMVYFFPFKDGKLYCCKVIGQRQRKVEPELPEYIKIGKPEQIDYTYQEYIKTDSLGFGMFLAMYLHESQETNNKENMRHVLNRFCSDDLSAKIETEGIKVILGKQPLTPMTLKDFSIKIIKKSGGGMNKEGSIDKIQAKAHVMYKGKKMKEIQLEKDDVCNKYIFK